MVGSFEMSDATSGQLSPDGLWRWDGVAWVAAGGGPSLPRWLPIGLLAPATWRVLALASVVALLADQAFRVGRPGFGAAGKLDVGYLGSLSGDSVPALVGASASLPANHRVRLSGAVCTGDHEYEASWAAFNLGDYLAVGSSP
jgi:hypothetical protein